MGDARAVWQFLRVAAEERGADVMENAVRQMAQLPALPAHIERATVVELGARVPNVSDRR